MNLELRITSDNDALQAPAELARILRAAADRIETEGAFGIAAALLRDVNGNTVGQLDYQPEAQP